MSHKALLTWAYDGSGIALRVPADCFETMNGQVSVVVHTTDSEVVRTLDREYEVAMCGCDEYHMWVPIRALSDVGTAPATESWNYND